jgi:DNA-directed RNA polymerase subunit F
LESVVGEIKSAWELAMEKVEKLGKLSPEEVRRQKEEKYGSIGQGLAEKYLTGLALRDVRIELDKYKGEEGELVRAALASKLIDAIELGDAERLSKVIEGISELNLKSREGLAGIRAEIEQLFGEYREAEQKKRREVDAAARGVLHQLRISGSAIGSVNPEVVPEWKNELDKIAQPYRERLDDIKARLAGLPA